MPRRRRRLLLRAASVGIGSVAALAVAEVALRWTREPDRYYPLPAATTLRTGPWDSTVTPGIDGYAYCVTNSFGCRGPEPSGERKRLLTVGGSTCICTGLDDTEAWPQLVMEGVNARVGDERFLWVTNSGLSGRNSRHHIMHAKHLVPRIGKLDHVLFYCGLNDMGKWVYDTTFDPDFLEKPQNWNDTVAVSFHLSDYTVAGLPWYQTFELWRLVKHVQVSLENADHASRNVPQDGGAEHRAQLRAERQERLTAGTTRVSGDKMKTFDAGLSSYRKNLHTIVDLVRERGAEPVFMTQFTRCSNLDERETSYHWLAKIDDGAAYLDPDQLQAFVDTYNDVMRDVAAARGVPLIDLPALMASEVDDSACFDGLFHDGVHFSERGSRLVADRVSQFLVDRVYR